MTEQKKSVLVGMSGGVDSTVTALLLQEQGYDVTGVTFKLWKPEDEQNIPEEGCCSKDDISDAKKASDLLGISHYVFDYEDMFKQKVVQPFAQAYCQGRTPNPCVVCNREIKFSNFLKRAKGMGYDYIATGHYANIVQDEEGIFRLKKADSNKDQSYVLYGINEEQLQHVLMPLGKYTKDEVREIAQKRNLEVANRPDSQDICFVPDGDYVKFLQEEMGISNVPGDFITADGEVLGEHKGIHNYTIGQRKGLGLSLPKPMFVKEINLKDNTVILAYNEDLFSKEFIVKDINLINNFKLSNPMRAKVKIRYAAEPEMATLTVEEDDCYKVSFDKPVRAITPGQAAVFYDGDYVLGGGTIEKVL